MAHDPNAPRPEWPPRIIRDFPPYDNQGNWPGGTDVVRDIQKPVPVPPAGGGGPQMSPADEAQQLQRAYRQFLGRAASPQEIQGWLSGAYGHGQSGNLLPIFEAIRTSSEAQQRPPVNRPMGPPDFPRPGGGYPGPRDMQTMRPQGMPSAKPLGGQDVQRMRRAILGVPEY